MSGRPTPPAEPRGDPGRFLVPFVCLVAACTTPSGPRSPALAPYAPDAPDRSAYAGCDAAGEIDYGDDGNLDASEYTVHDGSGWPILAEHRQIVHGSEQIEVWTDRNAWGLYTRYELDEDGDGATDRIEVGEPTDHVWDWLAVDDDGDGRFDVRTRYTNASGVPTHSEIDEGDDGTVDVVGAFAYDERWRLVVEQRDRGADGSVDEWWQTTWTGEASVTVHAMESGDNEQWRAVYDDGRLVLYAWDDLDADDAFERTYTWSDGLLTREDVIEWQDAELAYTGVIAYGHDAAGRLTSKVEAYDSADDGVVDLAVRSAWTWSCPAGR